MRAEVARLHAALGDRPAWLVGGSVRDLLLGRATRDFDLLVGEDPEGAARVVRRALGGAAFALSERHGAWRVVGPGGAWQLDLVGVQGGSLEADLALRDFTINAMAAPLGAVDAIVDPLGGRGDLAARTLRAASPTAIERDPLRALRAIRFGAELEFGVDAPTRALVAAGAGGLREVAAERIWAELRRVLAAPGPREAIEAMLALGIADVILPELGALGGVEQSVYHHRDVLGHTLEVLDAAVELERDPASLGVEAEADRLHQLLAEPLAEGVTRGVALRLAALLHDIAKPQTQHERPDGRGYGFPGHHHEGADVTRVILRRLRAPERVGEHVASMVREHLRLGFLVDDGPLTARATHRYLVATGSVAADVTALTVADRVATRGRHADAAIAAHVRLADTMLGYVFAAREAPPLKPLVRGDALAAALGITPGPVLGELLAALAEDRYAGLIATEADAVERAGVLLAERGAGSAG